MQKFWPLLLLIAVGLVALALIGLDAGSADSQPLTKLVVEDVKVGNGEKAEPGDKVTVHYTGTLAKGGKKFDSSVDRGKPFQFTLGAGMVIQGWDQGVAGMKVGGKRILKIPANLAYGPQAKGADIPANSDLVFEVELLKVEAEETKPAKKLEIEDLKVGDGEEAKPGNTVSVNYTGWLAEGGKQFDSNKDPNKPFKFKLGAGGVIRGWDLGVAGMKVGGKRKLMIPAHLGYGSKGAGADIPPDADLVFDVELLKVE
jgi:FKBP-type peptidyl-prolyl cis-trans isomerase